MTENQRLKLIQRHLGFSSQEDFATVLGIKQGSLSDIYRAKNGIRVSDSIKMKLVKEFSINIEWLEKGIGDIQNKKSIVIDNSDNKGINNNINGEVSGSLTISQNELSDLFGLNNDINFMNKELSQLLKTSQEQLTESQKQLTESQKQINILLEIIKNK